MIRSMPDQGQTNTDLVPMPSSADCILPIYLSDPFIDNDG